MLHSRISAHEERFRTELVDSEGTKYTQEPISENGFEFKRIRPIDFDNYYIRESTKKNLIVLHATEGYLKGDLASLVKEGNTVSVQFIVARNGEIYELFDQDYWAWHLGRGAVGGNRINSSRSIAIELSNAGVLERRGDILYDYNREYCKIDETDQYYELKQPYREKSYFAKYTNKQYESLYKLIDYLADKYDIPKRYLNDDERYNLFDSSDDARNYSGICTHVNFIKSGKWDIGPAFEWSRFTNSNDEGFIKSHPKKIDEQGDDIHIQLDDIEIKSEEKEDIPKEVPENKEDIRDEPEPPEPPKKKEYKKPSGIFGMILDIISELLGRNSV